MSEPHISRRRVLRGVTAGVAATGMASTAPADGTDRHVVGLTADAGFGVARRRADSVHRELDFGRIGKAVAGSFSEEALAALENAPAVRYVEPDGAVHTLSQSLPWGVDRVDAEVAHANGESGNGADVAIVDTGIDSDHPDLQDNIAGGRCFSTCCGQASCSNGNRCHYSWDDDNGHGTHCAGIVAAEDNDEGVVGVAPAANLWAVKVLDGCGSGSFSDVATGIQWAADQGHDVASMSLGTSTGSSTLRDACQYAYEKGVFLVAAAGNDGSVSYPAAYDTVVAVSATTCTDMLAANSATGPEIELAAPGEDICSTVPGGYEARSGTSTACQHVAGGAAQLMVNGYSNTGARQHLKDTAEDIGLSEEEQGEGLVDVAAALGFDSSDDATCPLLSCSGDLT